MSVCNAGTAPLTDTASAVQVPRRLTDCPACGNGRTLSFFRVPRAPVLCHALSTTRSDAKNVERSDIDLHYCKTCGLIFNAAFDFARVQYNPEIGYENSQQFSPRFRRYLESTAARLHERYELRGKTILEIGSGDGFFLRELSRDPTVRALAIEPTCSSVDVNNVRRSIHTVPDWADLPHQENFADLVVCRHVLEHLEDPRAFLTKVQVALTPGGSVFFEVPRSEYLFERFSFWDVLYEHCLYFTSESLTALFRSCGFQQLEVRSEFDGQMLTIESPAANPRANERLSGIQTSIDGFQPEFARVRECWNVRLRHWERESKQVVLWGAGTKGVMFLNTVDEAAKIEIVMDVNPRKHGRYVSGTGQKIVGPEMLSDMRPDVVLAMNPMYEPEIREMLSAECPPCAVFPVLDLGRRSDRQTQRTTCPAATP